MVSKVRTLINAAVVLRERGSFVFNDKMKNGGRSIKVWQWNRSDYEFAANLLRKAGYRVVIKQYVRQYPRWRRTDETKTFTVTRLHVFE